MALDLGTLSAKIKLDGLDDYIKGLEQAEKASRKQTEEEKKQSQQRQEALKQAKKTQAALNTINTYSDKIWSGVKTGAKAAIGAVSTLSAGIVAIGKKAIDAYANTEQLYGGVNKIFGDSAQKVIDNASKAYETAGLSANDYMETVTKFSASLLQSVGNDTEKAATIADMAVQDMSDNANTYGSNIADIQNAYQGFSKQNYTMLDNLRLGYGGTRAEMQRLLSDANKINKENGKTTNYQIDNLNDMMSAIHVVQQETQIAGTTQREAAKTIEGSINSAKAAWNNLLAGFADPDADLDKLTDNFVNSLDNAIANVEPAIGRITDSLEDSMPEILAKLSPVVDDILDLTLDTLGEAADIAIDNIPALMEKVTGTLFKVLQKLVKDQPAVAFVALSAGIAKVGVSVGQAVPVVKELYSAFKVLNSTAKLGAAPLAAIAIAAVTITADIALWIEKEQELQKQLDTSRKMTTDYTATMNGLSDSVDGMAATVEDSGMSFDSWIDSASDYVEKMRELETSCRETTAPVSNLKDEIEKLTSKTKLSSDEYAQLKGLVATYNKQTGNSIEVTGNNQKALEKLEKQINKTAKAYINEAYSQQYADRLSETITQKQETQDAYDTAKAAYEEYKAANPNSNVDNDEQLKTLKANADNARVALNNLTLSEKQYSQALSNNSGTTEEYIRNNEAVRQAVKSNNYTLTDFANKLVECGYKEKELSTLTADEANAFMNLNDSFGNTKGFNKAIRKFRAAGGSLQELSSLTSEEINEVISTLNSGGDKAGSKGVRLANKFKKGVASGKDGAKSAGKQIKDAAADGMDGSDKAEGLGKDFGQGFIDGIGSLVGSVAQAAANFVSSAIESARKAQDSNSPSKVTRGLGNDFGSGYWLGIEDQETNAIDAAYSLSNSAINSINMPSSYSLDAVEYPQSGGVVYNIYVDDNVINDTPAIKEEVQGFITTLARKGLM